MVDIEEQLKKVESDTYLDENFYGDQDFDMNDFDPDGYEVGEGDRYSDGKY